MRVYERPPPRCCPCCATPAVVAGLGRALEDAEASVRAAAALALGNSRRPDASSFLLGHLDDADPEVRQAVIAALEDLGDPRAVVPLIGRIQEQRASLRRQAALALGALGDARAVGALDRRARPTPMRACARPLRARWES